VYKNPFSNFFLEIFPFVINSQSNSLSKTSEIIEEIYKEFTGLGISRRIAVRQKKSGTF